MLTYAGSEVCVEDQGGALQGWLDQFLATEDLRDWCPPSSCVSQRANSRSGFKHAVSLPRPNYPKSPRWKLNTLYWPTGASRWARCYLIVTDTQLDVIAADEGGVAEPLPLIISDGINEITAEMYALPPRPITGRVQVAPMQGLWLLPLVDQRYFWQFRDAGNYSAKPSPLGNFQDWPTAFSTLATALGITVAPDSRGKYQIPDPDELTRNNENAAVLLDALAHSIGQRIIVQPNGAVSCANWTTSGSLYQGNDALIGLMGNDFSDQQTSAVYPSQVNVCFLKWYYGAPDPNGTVLVKTKAAGNYTASATISGTEKTIHTCAFANFSNGSGSADNDSECNDLAGAIAADYYASLAYRYDRSFPGVAPWTLSGYDDHVEWCMGRKTSRPQYQAFTRVQSAAPNFGVEEQLSQFADTPVYPSLTRFQFNAQAVSQQSATLNPGQSATGYHLEYTGGQYQLNTNVPTGANVIQVYDFGSRFAALDPAAKIQGWAQFKADSLRWEIVELMQKARFIHFTFTVDATSGSPPSSPNATVIDFWDGVNPGTSVKVELPPTTTAGGLTVKAGKDGTAVYNDRKDIYEAIDWDC